MMNDMLDKIIYFFKHNKTMALLAIGAAGLILILFSNMISQDTEAVSTINSTEKNSSISDDEFISSVESRLKTLLADIEGAGECEVMVTVTSSAEVVYVKEDKSSMDDSGQSVKNEKESSVITVSDSSGNETALITKQISPEIGGVTIVSRGANDINVKSSIIQAVSTVLGIGANKVCVVAKAA